MSKPKYILFGFLLAAVLVSAPVLASLTLNSTTVTSDGALNLVSTGNFELIASVPNADTLVFSPKTGGEDPFSGTFTSVDLTANRTWTLPNVSGTIITTGDTGTVTNAMLAGSITEGKLSFTDVTTGDATSNQHGLLPKLPGNTTTFLRGDGTWAEPAGGGEGSASASDITAGTFSFALQSSATPGFLAYNSADDTGVNEVATIDFDTEVYDTTNSFANDTFTAPVTGIYHLCATVKANDAFVDGSFIIHTSNRDYYIGYSYDVFSGGLGGYDVAQSSCVYADMDANDTARVINGWGWQLDFVRGGGSPYPTYFSGRLVP